MEEKAITKLIVWTGGRWIDQETGIYASNLGPPHDTPLIPRIEATPGAMYGHLPFSITREQIQVMIDDAFKQRVTPEYPFYFANDQWPVTMRDLRSYTDNQVTACENRLRREINKSWWKRW